MMYLIDLVGVVSLRLQGVVHLKDRNMALNTLESRIRYRLSRSKDLVFAPKDFLDLSDRDQIGRVLRKLVAEKSLVRIARGLYAKTKISSVTGKTIPADTLPALAKEGLTKIGAHVVPSRAEQAYNSGETTQVPTGRVIAIKGKSVSRKIGYDGTYIVLEHATR